MDEPFVGHSVNRILMPATLEEARRTELAFQKPRVRAMSKQLKLVRGYAGEEENYCYCCIVLQLW